MSLNNTTRTDCHCPSRLIPADYEYVAQEYRKIEDLGDAMFMREQREAIARHMAATGGNYSGHSHGGNCMVCGSVNAIYTILFYHRPSNTYIRTGQECAELIDRAAADGLERLRKSVRDAREAVAGKRKAAATLAELELTAAWDIYTAGTSGREECTLRNIIGKLVQYGNISEAQVKFVRSLMQQIADRPQREAKRAAEAEAAAPCPTGRVQVSGEILTVRVDETQYGMVTKMLVKADSGFKVWGSMPAHANGNRGDRIVFKAAITPSDTDPKFGFAKRPVLVSIEPAAEAVSA